MTEDKGILIKNIYYMLSYAFQTLKQNNFESIASEDFDDIYELFSEILFRGVSFQLKQGLHKNYISRHDTLRTIRGKIDLNGTIHNLSTHRQLIDCEYDELSENNILNQIVKTTIMMLLRCKDMRESKKLELRKNLKQILLYFNDIDTIEPQQIKWDSLRFDRNNKNYQMLVYICQFVIRRLVMTTEKGKFKMKQFSDEHMNLLFEKFILEYYRKNHPELSPKSANVDWNIKQDDSTSGIIPNMRTDITLTFPTRTLIIDAKYYGKAMAEHFDKKQIRTNNLYQIFTYVTNADTQHIGNVDGMLLYAKTEEDVVPDGQMKLNDGNTIYFKTLDLNKNFDEIKNQLEQIVKTHIPIS